MSIGDLITYICLVLAVWYVPRYLLRVYAPGLYARIKLSIENAVRELQERDYARYQAKQVARRYVTYDDDAAPVPSAVPVPVPLPSLGTGAIDIAALADNLTEDQYIELGARLRDRNGKPIYSGKRLYTLAGGNHDEFLANMRRWRGDLPDAPVYTTPIVGRATSARFETDPDFPYQSPA